jgi:cyclic beta-1,2-glucan synthetase
MATVVSKLPVPALVGLLRLLSAGALVATLGWLMRGGSTNALLAAVVGALALQGFAIAVTGRRASLATLPLDAAVFGLLGLACDPALKLWAAPQAALDLLRLTPTGALVAAGLYLAVALLGLTRRGRRPGFPASLALLALPFLFNLLLGLGSPLFDRAAGAFAPIPLAVTRVLLRGLALFIVNEAIVHGACLAMGRRAARDFPLHVLLLAAAFGSSVTPIFAELGSAGFAAHLWTPILIPYAALTAAAAQAGLWAEVYLVTSVLGDILHKAPPVAPRLLASWRSGAEKGAVYGGVFMALLLVAAAFVEAPGAVDLLRASSYLGAALLGAALFPLARTILESSDSTPPFPKRLRAAYLGGSNYAAGAVAGAGLLYAFANGLPATGDAERFGAGFVIGALAYFAALAYGDVADIGLGLRGRPRPWRPYALGALLGGVLGGAIAWYFDAAQLDVVVAHFRDHVAINYPAAGRPESAYVITPFFSKWGATDMGLVSGGVKLLYLESLSGVIQWIFAAPLFSVNLFFLTALLRRDTAPIKKLFSAEGMTGLADNAIVVLRWGLWMAPIIYAFLKVAPDPQWYNQDGLIRTGVATWMSATLPPSEFRDWSLSVFTALLTYDWLRVLIWFDHMGLRVATLVNLSFVGGDMADESAARFLGARGRSRAIPEAIRRFGTWAPLLIPFYIPRGAEWDKAWTAAEIAARAHTPALVSLLLGYGLAALASTATLALFLLTRARAKTPAQSATLTNGLLSLGLQPDGQNFLRVETAARRGAAIDMTRAPDDALIPRGGFIYFQEQAGDETRFWSLTPAPTGSGFGPLEALSPVQAKVRGEIFDLRCEASIELVEGEALALTRLKLTNASARPRLLRLATYRDWVMNEGGVERRDAAYNALHVGTAFIRDFAAIFARNRLLKNQEGDFAAKRLSREIAFHAARPQAGVRLIGYEDVRARFFGLGQRRDPDALTQHLSLRDPAEEGLLYGFDPCAVLLLEVEIPADGALDLLFADGWASDERAAARALARAFDAVIPENLDALFARRRALAPAITPPKAPLAERFAFSADGRELQTTPGAPRPFSHVLANPVGFGAVVTHDGEIFTFHRNARANSVTPFRIGEGRNAPPAQAIYVVEGETGETHTATLLPLRRDDTTYDARFALGAVIFTAASPRLELRQEVFVAPDDAVQIQLVTLTNRTDRIQVYRVALVAEILLTETPAEAAGAVRAHADDNGSALYFHNASNDFVRDWLFAATSLEADDCEVSRAKILGRKRRDPLTPFLAEHGHADGGAIDDGRRAAGFACQLEVAPGASARVSFVLGAAPTLEAAQALAHRAATLGYADEKRALVTTFWDSLLSRLRIKTNQPAFDRLVNDWLPYQALAARLWGRTGPAQRSGAFGYRDQLQDVLPMVTLAPEIARRQILLHARQQFVQGDVLKWWHLAPDGGVGIGERTHAADPHLWLPYVTARYVAATGDTAILHEQIGFVEGAPVPHGVEGHVISPLPSTERASLIEHCRRAIDYTLAHFGAHGLPLMGAGDWDDGMNLVGFRGKGESVWMGFFLYDNLIHFAALLRREKQDRLADDYEARAEALRFALDACWRGDRYVRAFADDGQEFLPVGAMSAAWPALSGAAQSERGRNALERALAELDKGDRVLLVTPPYDENSKPFPGRSGDYPPGVRENGGQYTHGSSWFVDALARLAGKAAEEGDTEQAARDYDRAFEVWRSLSPLTKTTPDKIDIYGLPPHQQPADVYDGPGYEGRGGWAWYSGAASRMISAAHALLGISVENGALRLRPDAFADKAGLKLESVTFKGRIFTAPEAHAAGPTEQGRPIAPDVEPTMV